MTKYNQQFKQQVVDFYFANHENLPQTFRRFGVARQTVRRWIAQFRHAGANGLAVLHTTRTYTPEFKRQVVQAVRKGEFSAEEACLRFGIANSGVVSQWLKAVLKEGIKGLEPKPKGRKPMSTKRPKYAKMPPKPTNRLEELELKNLRLRAEVAYLKKLDELIRAEEERQRKAFKR